MTRARLQHVVKLPPRRPPSCSLTAPMLCDFSGKENELYALERDTVEIRRLSVRREKALDHSGMKDPPGNWIAPPGRQSERRWRQQSRRSLRCRGSHKATWRVCRL